MQKRIGTVLLLFLALAIPISAQSRANRIFRPCPASTTPASVSVSRVGAISLIPCSGQGISITGAFTLGFTQGSVVFAGTSGSLSQDNSNFFWDDSSDLLRLGANASGQMKIGVQPTNSNFSGMWFGQATPSDANWSIRGTSFAGAESLDLNLPNNTTAQMRFLSGNTTYGYLGASKWSFGLSGAVTTDTTVTINSSSTATWKPLVLKLAAAQSANAFEIQPSGSATPDFSIGPTGIVAPKSGSAVPSAATIAITGNLFHVTGTTTITSVSGTGVTAGTPITIIFDGILTFTDGSNLKLAGNFVTTADDSITLVYDGTNWYETARAVN